jgi:myosin heavy subunit
MKISTPFITEQKRIRTGFETRYLAMYGTQRERGVDLPGLSPGLIQKRQELEQVQQTLTNERINYEHWLKEHQQRKNDLDLRKQEFDQESATRKAVHERARDDIEKIRALTDKEDELREKYERQMDALMEKEQQLKDKVSQYHHQLDKLKPAADFIDRVVQETMIFESAEDVLQRWDILVNSKADWTEELRKQFDVARAISNPREKLNFLQQLLVQKRCDLRNLREDIAKLRQQDRYDQILQTKTVERSIEKDVEEATVYSAIANMCRQTLIAQEHEATRFIGPVVVPPTAAEQLEIVKQRFLDLQAVITDPDIVYLSVTETAEPASTSPRAGSARRSRQRMSASTGGRVSARGRS